MMPRTAIASCEWPIGRLGEAIATLGTTRANATAGEPPRPPTVLENSGTSGEPRALGRWIEAAAAWLGMEAEPATIACSALARELCKCAPAIVRVPASSPPQFLLVRGGSRGRVSLIAPDLDTRRFPGSDVATFLRAGTDADIAPQIDAILEGMPLAVARRERVRKALWNERLRGEEFEGVWMLRPGPASSFARSVKHAGLYRHLVALAAAHAAEYVCWILAWWLVGLGAMQGRIDRGWLVAWVLLLVTVVPLRLAATWLQGTIAIAGGAILKQRLLLGGLKMEPDEIGREGAGHLLGRVMESEAVESLALSGGFLALVSLIELLFAALVLSAGAGGAFTVAALVIWTALIVWLAWRYTTCNRSWAAARLRLTHDLVERMIGHRTRAVQEPSERWHDGEDQDLERYIDVSSRMDRQGVRLSALGARGWLLLAVAAMAPSFLSGSTTPAALAIGVGGALLAYRAFRRLTAGAWHLAEAWVAAQQVGPLLRAAARAGHPGAPDLVVQQGRDGASGTVLEAHDLTFRHGTRPKPILNGVSLRIERGDRVLLEGASGAGKSTLAAVLASLRAPEAGLLLAGGLDRRTLGAEGWRRRVAAAPQFHENHIITGTFAFNILMSRPDWPPSKEDLALLEPLCHELGLDDLLARMPGGVMQMVGESGWQLSHGERSRIFLARALVQESSLVVLDESFAALDSLNLTRVMASARQRAPALLVIGHR
jgi:ATP-binding cassette subfamily B protein